MPATVITSYSIHYTKLYDALDLNSGKKHWEYDCDNQIIGSANWWKVGDKTHIFVGSYDFYLHCVDAKNGEGLWKYETDNFINGAPACEDGMAMFGGCDGRNNFV